MVSVSEEKIVTQLVDNVAQKSNNPIQAIYLGQIINRAETEIISKLLRDQYLDVDFLENLTLIEHPIVQLRI